MNFRTWVILPGAGFLAGAVAAFALLPFWSGPVATPAGDGAHTPPAHSVTPTNAGSAMGADDRRKTASASVRQAELITQIHSPGALRGAAQIWIPTEWAQRLCYFSAGSFSNTFKLDPEAMAMLEIDQATQMKIEADTDAFLAQIRQLEIQSAQDLKRTSDTIVMKIPAGFAPPEMKDAIRDRLHGYLSKERAELFTRQFFRGLSDVTSAFQDGDCIITVRLEGGRQSSTEIQQANHSMGFGGLPDFLKHLIKLQDDNGQTGVPPATRSPSK